MNGGKIPFPGTYSVRPETLRAVFMDLATELAKSRAFAGSFWFMRTSGRRTAACSTTQERTF